MLTFPDRENTGNLVILIFTQGKLWQHRENIECVCVLCVYDVWGIYSGEYISQLYVRDRPYMHLICHPVDALKWAK